MINNNPKITIVIPTVNIDSIYLSRLVKSIYKHTSCKNFNLIILKNDWRGFAKVINEGLRMFLADKDSDYVFLLNDDTMVMPDWDKHFIKILDSKDDSMPYKVGIVGDIFTRMQGDHLAFWAVMLPREVIETVGLLDEKFYNGFEDLEYCDRIKAKGYKIYTTKYNFIQHVVTNTIDLIPQDIRKQMDRQNSDLYEGKMDVLKTDLKEGGDIVDKQNQKV